MLPHTVSELSKKVGRRFRLLLDKHNFRNLYEDVPVMNQNIKRIQVNISYEFFCIFGSK